MRDLDGVRWIRGLLRQLADEGRTVLVQPSDERDAADRRPAGRDRPWTADRRRDDELRVENCTAVGDRLPGTSALFLLLGDPTRPCITQTSSVLTMVARATCALLLGRLRLAREDTNR